jgi:predicted RNase H-like nuclease (RuvC/YqgF family)
MRELRKENSKLKSEVRQLRKSLRQHEHTNDQRAYRDELDGEVKYLENAIEESGKKLDDQLVKKCPHCGSKDCKFFEVVGRPYFKCEYEGCLKKGFLDKK